MKPTGIIYTARGIEELRFEKALIRESVENNLDAWKEFFKAFTSSEPNLQTVQIKPELVDVFKPKSVVRSIFNFITMGAEQVPYWPKTSLPSVKTGSESDTPTESKIGFGAVKYLQAKTLYSYVRITQTAMEYTESIVDLITEHINDMLYDLGVKEDINAWNGKGDDSDEFNVWTGLTQASGVQTVNKEKAAIDVDTINDIIAYFETLGAYDRLVMIGHPLALKHLRKAIYGTTNAGMMAVAGRVFESGEIVSLLGLEKIVSTPHIGRRDYGDGTYVSDIIIVHPKAAVGGDRRKPQVVKQMAPLDETVDIAWDVKLIERAGFLVLRPEAVYVIQNVLAQ